MVLCQVLPVKKPSLQFALLHERVINSKKSYYFKIYCYFSQHLCKYFTQYDKLVSEDCEDKGPQKLALQAKENTTRDSQV